ncbi:MAG: DUF4170 domain-containing protein [Rhodospirillales bacterium]|nr:DUF4170 domain-containing protein [Rhodospirillales bacterium]MBO6786671.1 DUF4170 domain-containing protein [Rhodospirillales bacterium]
MSDKPLLHLVFGGEVADPSGTDFVDTEKLDIVGIYPNYQTALTAWRGASQAHVDDANTKYVIVHMHRLLDPEEAG